jgi:hypothetical protein
MVWRTLLCGGEVRAYLRGKDEYLIERNDEYSEEVQADLTIDYRCS